MNDRKNKVSDYSLFSMVNDTLNHLNDIVVFSDDVKVGNSNWSGQFQIKIFR